MHLYAFWICVLITWRSRHPSKQDLYTQSADQLIRRVNLMGDNHKTLGQILQLLSWPKKKFYWLQSGRTVTEVFGPQLVNYESCYRNLALLLLSCLVQMYYDSLDSGFCHNSIYIYCQKKVQCHKLFPEIVCTPYTERTIKNKLFCCPFLHGSS